MTDQYNGEVYQNELVDAVALKVLGWVHYREPHWHTDGEWRTPDGGAFPYLSWQPCGRLGSFIDAWRLVETLHKQGWFVAIEYMGADKGWCVRFVKDLVSQKGTVWVNDQDLNRAIVLAAMET